MNPSTLIELSSASSVAAALASWPRTRVAATFLWRHWRLPRLSKPRNYNEWVQWRKLNDRDVEFAMLTDKLHAKALASKLVGSSFIIPTLWQGDKLPNSPPWPMPFIVKANHGCRQFVVVRSMEDWRVAQRAAPRWLKNAYGHWLDEWHYRAAKRILLVEPFIGPAIGLPVDYKVFVFGGTAQFVQVHLGRGGNHRWAQFDRNFRQVSSSTKDAIARPERLDEMLEAAERIAVGRDHLRVDFYEAKGRLWFGELCLFPGSGLDRFDPPDLDETFGKFWTASRNKIATSSEL
jgi:hypothetical protein